MVCSAATTQQCIIAQAALLHYRSDGLLARALARSSLSSFTGCSPRTANLSDGMRCKPLYPRQNCRKWPMKYFQPDHPITGGVGRAFPLHSLGGQQTLLPCMSQKSTITLI